VCIDDPAYVHYDSVQALPPHVLRELDRFFRDYKALEGTQGEVEVGELYGRERALDVIGAARAAYDGGRGR